MQEYGRTDTATSLEREGGADCNLRDYPFLSQKNQEGCGCPKFPAGKVFRQISTLLENDSPIFRQREMLSLPRFGHWKIGRACGNAAGFSPLRPPQPS